MKHIPAISITSVVSRVFFTLQASQEEEKQICAGDIVEILYKVVQIDHHYYDSFDLTKVLFST